MATTRWNLPRTFFGAFSQVKSHEEWLEDVVAHCENEIEVKFPIIGDADRSISTAYGMIDPATSGEQELPLTIRAVFIINPENKLMLSLN